MLTLNGFLHKNCFKVRGMGAILTGIWKIKETLQRNVPNQIMLVSGLGYSNFFIILSEMME